MLFSQAKTTEYEDNRNGLHDTVETSSLTTLSSGGLGELQTTITSNGRHGNAGETVTSVSSGKNSSRSHENGSRNNDNNGEQINHHATLQAASDRQRLISSTATSANKGAGGGNNGSNGHSWISSTTFPDTSGLVGSTDYNEINSNKHDGSSGGKKDSLRGNGEEGYFADNSSASHFNGIAGKNNASTISNSGNRGYSQWTTNTYDEYGNGPSTQTDFISPLTLPQKNSTSKNGKDFMSTRKTPAGGSSSSEDEKGNIWWVYLLVSVGVVILFIILIIFIKRCKRKKKRKNSIKSESMGTPLLTDSRSNSGSRSITPPIPMAISTPQIVPESPISPPKLLALPPATYSIPSTLGSCFEASHEIYTPSQGIWSSVSNSKDDKNKKQERRLSSSFINLPDVIISVPHSKHVTLKQLHPPNKIYVESSP